MQNLWLAKNNKLPNRTSFALTLTKSLDSCRTKVGYQKLMLTIECRRAKKYTENCDNFLNFYYLDIEKEFWVLSFVDHGMCLVLWIYWYWKGVWYNLRDGGIQQKCNLVTELEEPIQLIVSNFILEQPFLLKILLKSY